MSETSKFHDGPFPDDEETVPDGLQMSQHPPGITRDVADQQMRDSIPPAEIAIRLGRIEAGIGMIIAKLSDIQESIRKAI